MFIHHYSPGKVVLLRMYSTGEVCTTTSCTPRTFLFASADQSNDAAMARYASRRGRSEGMLRFPVASW